MRFWKSTRAATASLACCGLLLPPGALAQETARAPAQAAVSSAIQPAPQGRVVDIQLDHQQTLVGRVAHADGSPVAGLTVQLWQRNQLHETLASNERGDFRFQNLPGGTYQIAIGNDVHVLRCWATGSAPPHARDMLRLTVSEETVRGQGFPPTCGVVNPWIIAGVAAAAIVIPIALHNNRSDRKASE